MIDLQAAFFRNALLPGAFLSVGFVNVVAMHRLRADWTRAVGLALLGAIGGYATQAAMLVDGDGPVLTFWVSHRTCFAPIHAQLTLAPDDQKTAQHHQRCASDGGRGWDFCKDHVANDRGKDERCVVERGQHGCGAKTVAGCDQDLSHPADEPCTDQQACIG